MTDTSHGIAHEILNPMAVISGMCNQLEKRFASMQLQVLDEKSTTMLGAIRKHSDRVCQIVQSMRSLVRNDQKDPFIPAALCKIVNDSLELCQDRCKMLAVKIITSDIPDITIECASGQISQVLINLLNNALNAAEMAKERWIKVECRSDSSTANLTIAVTDSGTGIPLEIRQKIFEPFFTTKGTGQGTGLGLSISKGIAQAHHGELFLDESSVNTRFVLQLPLKQIQTTKSAEACA